MMRKSLAFLLLPLVLAGCHPPDSMREAFAGGHPPVLDSITPKPGGMAEFRFHAVDGNVVVLHRDLLESIEPRAPLDVSIDATAEEQKAGASFTDTWSCQGAVGRLKIRAYLIDANHHHSEPLDYTVECGG